MRRFHDEVREAASNEGKIPIAVLMDRDWSGCLLIMASKDIDALISGERECLAVERVRTNAAARSLYEKASEAAAKEGKVPVVAVIDKGRHDFLFVFGKGDLETIIRERMAARGLTDGPGQA